MEMDVKQIAINAIKKIPCSEFSKEQTSEALRQALIEANGGSTKISLKNFYRGSELFALVEELIPVMIEEGLKDDDFIARFVDYRNVKDGDEAEFYIEDPSLFVVADAAAGIKGVRRQKLMGGVSVPVKASMKIVRVYDDLERLLSGRISFDEYVARVAESFKKQVLADAYKALDAAGQATPGLVAENYVSGSYTEATLLDLVNHIEAYTGKKAVIVGTKAALRKVTTAVTSNETNADMYNLGYYGKFNGTDMLALRQVHKAGERTFLLDDAKLFVIAGDDKLIKMVNEGEGLMAESDTFANADLTKEYVYGQAYGTAVACAEQIGIYKITG